MIKSLIILIALNFSNFDPIEPVKSFQEVDQHARTIKKYGDYQETAEKLAEPFETDAEKARAIFIWIAENVSYDIQKLNRQMANPKMKRMVANSLEELEAIKAKHRKEIATGAFENEKGVCEDYAYLFQFMSEHVGLEVAFIPGYGRFSPQEVNRPHRGSNHAWNAIKIEGKWYLLDATWAAGTTDIRAGKFKKDYKEGLFMTPPERFILTHFPDDPKWQLLDVPVDKSTFTGLPYAFPELSNKKILDFFPKSGVLSKKGKTTSLGLKTMDREMELVLVENRRVSTYKAVYEDGQLIFNIASKHLKPGELTLAVIEENELKPIISYLVTK